MNRPDPNLEEDADRIAAELAALGEDPLDEDDDALAFALSNAPDVDVATLQTMALWADADAAEAGDDALSELAQARVWRTIELRTKSGSRDEPTPEPRRSTTSSRPLVLGVVVAMLAVAAGVLLVPVLTPSQPEPAAPIAKSTPSAPTVSAEELEVLSTQARAGLAALDRLSGEPRGSARAQAMADDYARRLEAEG